MMSWHNRSIWLYAPVIDFRKQMNGLANLVVSEMGRQPNDGGVYVFRNRQRDKVKVVFWDRNGFWLGYKRVERGKCDVPIGEQGQIEITTEQLEMLVSGMPMVYVGKDAEKSMVFS